MSDPANDFDFLHGSWQVRHRKLQRRLAGCDDWWEFDGTCTCWAILGGAGNIDDNCLAQPTGTYRGSSLRLFDRAARQWSIVWMNEGHATIEPRVVGGFVDGTGTFDGADTFDGRPIRVRFTWSAITPTGASWTQAFSPDGGTTWEPNWVMHFTRTG